jgi:V8-like Glu-specific endopeptidase
MIKIGVIVTAAHCVAEYGKNEIYKDFTYIPALKNKTAPYGIWSAKKVLVLKSYLQGTEGECLSPQSATICLDDVALIILKPKKGKYAGDLTGYLRVGLTGYSYSNGRAAQITSLGYPVSHDKGKLMQRNDSIGALIGKDFNYNTAIGSRMTGGSSGGPWIVNFGQTAKLSAGTTTGYDATPNVVVGVTSWGFTVDKYKYQFASPFLKSNIAKLLKTACRIDKKACR